MKIKIDSVIDYETQKSERVNNIPDITEEKFVATAFISCSLRAEDKHFVEFVEDILRACKVKPFGTVGKYSAAPSNPTVLMKQNIPAADIAVIVATPRYFQQDVHTGQLTSGIGEMLHVESGIAYASNKPILVFVQEGTSFGNFLPNVTQYIYLRKDRLDLIDRKDLIESLILNTLKIVGQQRKDRESSDLGILLAKGLAIFGGFKILEYLATDEKPRRKIKRQ